MDFERVYIEKKSEFNTEGDFLLKEFRDYLGIKNLKSVRVVNVYDLIGASKDEFKLIVDNLLYEKSLDFKYEDKLDIKDDEKAFRVEYLKGQYNKREDSAQKMAHILTENEDIEILNSKVIILENVDEDEKELAKSYYINPIEMKQVGMDSFNPVKEDTPGQVETLDGFIDRHELDMKSFKDKYGIGMDIEDLMHCQDYFRNEEKRDPTITELKLIDTYWSDHCRHTTFMSEITDVTMEEGKYKDLFQEALDDYIASRAYVYGERDKKMSLMDLATINMREISKKGLLDDKEETDEVNAASIEIDVDVDGENEKWLLMFKNETHNHPTEMEPFGGAATCLGGAIRDPLSGRSFVYQAMRITGSGDPRLPYEETLQGKNPQRKITKTARAGYSSYGYEIGAATGFVREIYDDGFVAKRMELGALVAAAPKSSVYRGDSLPGDLILLIGGRTGRDGLGGAVGSSREHTEESLASSGAEVQKGNPYVERKIMRLFRDPEASKMIKKCNDFGAGGVGVAIGELADGMLIDLDKVLLKYPGLDGTEIALSESQERMAVVIDKKDKERFMELVRAEDIEGRLVAEVTEEKTLKMVWNGNTIVSIRREFLDTNGIRKKSRINIEQPASESYLKENPSHIKGDLVSDFKANVEDLNICSQKGLVEGFDHTVGSGSVLMPLGGKTALTPAEGMAAKIPVLKGETTTCSLMSFGYDPKISKWSPFHGGYFAVIESIAKIVAMGGSHEGIRLSFQEYFERLGEDPSKWGKPFAALLGAYEVQKNLDAPSIGGKDSMSGTFEDINVPPTLVSFAVTTEKVENVISPEFKRRGSKIALIELSINEKGTIDFTELKEKYSLIKEMVDRGEILSASTVKYGGLARSIAEMSMGNMIGFEFKDVDKDKIFKPLYGSIVVELSSDLDINHLKDKMVEIGTTLEEENIKIDKKNIDLKELRGEYKEPLSDVFPINQAEIGESKIEYKKGPKIKRIKSIAAPKVLIPIITGAHGEYDMAKSFKRAGGRVDYFIFKTNDISAVKESYTALAEKIKNYQIIGFPNGSILGAEPETGGKLMKIILQNKSVEEEIMNHLYKRDGLILGTGAGFLGLMKSGLIQYGDIRELEEDSANIIYNANGEFLSKQEDIKVVSNLSPWFNALNTGDIFTSPIATKEGRISGDVSELIEKGQIATVYNDENPTGSTMGIESITSPDGRILGTISSIDRVGEDLYKNIEKKDKHHIFKSGIKYFG